MGQIKAGLRDQQAKTVPAKAKKFGEKRGKGRRRVSEACTDGLTDERTWTAVGTRCPFGRREKRVRAVPLSFLTYNAD